MTPQSLPGNTRLARAMACIRSREPALPEERERLAADLIENSDPGRRELLARLTPMRAVQLEQRLHRAGGTHDLDVAALGRQLVAQIEQERRRRSVEMSDRGEVELGARTGWASELAHPLPRRKALPEPKFSRKAQRHEPALVLDTLHVVTRSGCLRHLLGMIGRRRVGSSGAAILRLSSRPTGGSRHSSLRSCPGKSRRGGFDVRLG